jgi:hypothetical protein
MIFFYNMLALAFAGLSRVAYENTTHRLILNSYLFTVCLRWLSLALAGLLMKM